MFELIYIVICAFIIVGFVIGFFEEVGFRNDFWDGFAVCFGVFFMTALAATGYFYLFGV